MLFRRRLDAFPGGVALVVADVLHMIEAGDRVAHVSRALKRLRALFWKRELILLQILSILGAELSHGHLL